MTGYLIAFAAFLAWELTAVFRRWTRVTHRTLSEYVWQWVGRSRGRRAGVLVGVAAFGIDLACHLAFGTPLTGFIGY